MKYALFLGCQIPARVLQYEYSARAVFKNIGVEVLDIKEFNCCGYPMKNLNTKASILLSARNIALSEKADLDMVVLCQCCFGALKAADRILKEDASLREEINLRLEKEGLRYEGKIEIKHFLQVLYHDVGKEALEKKMKRKFSDLKLAVHCGCHALRPKDVTNFDDPFSPELFDQLVEITGAKSVFWSAKLDCCGAPVFGVENDLSLSLTKKKILSAKESGADYICDACAYCHMQFDSVQKQLFSENQIQETVPSILYSQLLGICMGIDKKFLGLDQNEIPLNGIEKFLS